MKLIRHDIDVCICGWAFNDVAIEILYTDRTSPNVIEMSLGNRYILII